MIFESVEINFFYVEFCSGCNVCQLNSEHQLLAIGTEEVCTRIFFKKFGSKM